MMPLHLWLFLFVCVGVGGWLGRRHAQQKTRWLKFIWGLIGSGAGFAVWYAIVAAALVFG